MQRLILIMGLAITSYLLILAWNEDYVRKPAAPAQEELSIPARETLDTLPSGDLPLADSGEIPDDIPESPVESNGLEVPLDTSIKTESLAPDRQSGRKLIRVETDVVRVLIDPLGGDLVRVSLLKFPVGLDTPDVAFVLMDKGNQYTAQTGLIGPDGTDGRSGRPLFRSVKQEYQLGNADELVVKLSLTQDSGVQINKLFTFHRSDYLIDVEYQVYNQTTKPWSAKVFAQIKRDGKEPAIKDESGLGMAPYLGGATYYGDEPYHKLEFEDLEEQAYRHKTAAGYVAMVQKYFVTAFVPEGIEEENTYQARKLAGKDFFLFGFVTADWSVQPGQQEKKGVKFYAGPKDQYRLRDIAAGLDLTIDYGFLWWLAQPLFWLLTHIHSLVGNWGFSIIILTMIVKTVLYPLSAASFKSMAKMRKLQPEMARLKERHGDDKQQFSVAMMDLYKKEGANPLGGCLPVLMQMPVFLALYWTLMESVEIRQAPFALWIHDLSAMDPYFVLPILMGGSMWLTQSMQPEPPDPMQAKVFKMMPIMFTFFFLWFPSGLVLYWLVNNVLSVIQQWFVTRQITKGN